MLTAGSCISKTILQLYDEPKGRQATMVRENPSSVIIIFLIIVVAVVGQMNKEDGGGLMMKSEVHSNLGAVPVVVLAVLVVLARRFIWRRGQPWRR